ncbi:MAG: acetylglutamate kinase [Polyangiaceae bacterium]
MDPVVEKAKILHEALPYIRRFHGRTFVVKYGGHAMTDDALKESFARDVCLLRYVGIRIVVVHGGGPQIDRVLERMGIRSSFESGLRVTDDATMEVVEMVLGGAVNQDIVGLVCKHGGRAVGLSGKDDHFIRARRLSEVAAKNAAGETVLVDLGRVGDIEHVDPRVVDKLLDSGFLPVIAPVAVDRGSRAERQRRHRGGASPSCAGRGQARAHDRRRGRERRPRQPALVARRSGDRVLIERGVIRGGMIEGALRARRRSGRSREGRDRRAGSATRSCSRSSPTAASAPRSGSPIDAAWGGRRPGARRAHAGSLAQSAGPREPAPHDAALANTRTRS